MANKILEIKCPHCQSLFNYYQSEFRPFCSERCRMIDFGHWMTETYAVPVQNMKNFEDEVALVEASEGNENESEESEENFEQ